MAIKLPDLDNRSFDDLMKEMIASIPKYAKEWTNFNPSDPGITVLELLAWISEALIYRANIVPVETRMNFLLLIAGAHYDGETGKLKHTVYSESDHARAKLLGYVTELTEGVVRPDPDSMKKAAQEFLASKFRAVTGEDFEKLAIEASPGLVKRVKVVASPDCVRIMVVVDPAFAGSGEKVEKALSDVRAYLAGRRLLGAIIDVKKAEYTDVGLSMKIVCESYAKSGNFGKSTFFASPPGTGNGTTEERIANEIFLYLDAVNGGPGKNGWPYGRDLMVYELFHIAEKIEGVKYVKEVLVSGSPFPEAGIGISGLINLTGLTISSEVLE